MGEIWWNGGAGWWKGYLEEYIEAIEAGLVIGEVHIYSLVLPHSDSVFAIAR